jgi:hypothetical protein
LVLLRVEIARFTQTELARLCCSNPHLRAPHLRGRLVSGQPLAATLPCAVRTFLQCLVSQIAPASKSNRLSQAANPISGQSDSEVSALVNKKRKLLSDRFSFDSLL